MQDKEQMKSAFQMSLSEAIAPRPMTKAERAKKRREEHIQQEIRESKSGVNIYLILSRYAINKAVSTEPNPEVREGKRASLLKMWRNFQNRLIGIMRS